MCTDKANVDDAVLVLNGDDDAIPIALDVKAASSACGAKDHDVRSQVPTGAPVATAQPSYFRPLGSQRPQRSGQNNRPPGWDTGACIFIG